MVNIKVIAVRAAVTALESFLAVVLATSLTGMDATGLQTALVTGLGAGLSVVYNAARAWLDSQAATSEPPLVDGG